MNGITVYQNGLGIDDKLSSKSGKTVRYFITDHLGSTVALADASGTITSSTTYDSFGNAASSIPTSYRYTGREYGVDTGLYYYRNRWYDPEIGKFISEDPIGFASGEINMYAYVHNNPLMFFDPLGMQKAHNSRRKSKKKNVPTVQKPTKPNECGPSKYPALEYAIPDTVGPLGLVGNRKYKMTPACDKHDICYATCGKTQEQCDVQFGKDIYDICKRAGGMHLDCFRYKLLYEWGVWIFGEGSYQDAQKEAGCVPCKDASPQLILGEPNLLRGPIFLKRPFF